MSDKKVFAIDPNLFSFSKNTTRKKRDKSNEDSKIKMKVAKPKKNDSLKKRSILNMIRKHQETEYKNKFDNSNKKTTNDVQNFNSDFKNATDFFKNLEDNVTQKTISKPITNNHTIKQYPNVTNPLPKTSYIEPSMINTTLPTTLNNITDSIKPAINELPAVINTNIAPTPKYGCLKNGSLPTYRSFMNQTRKKQPDIIGGKPPDTPISVKSNNLMSSLQSSKIKEKIENINLNKKKKKKMKRKKTIRRTHKIGRSRIMPKVSVLVSNKTIRNNISTKTQLIKQVPIHEIRKYLIKHGFIKVGSTTPNDVLRKMYESAMLICGEIQNHNPDNLLYNFLHDVEK
jgi:hypothetical protein